MFVTTCFQEECLILFAEICFFTLDITAHDNMRPVALTLSEASLSTPCLPFFCALVFLSMFFPVPGARRQKADPKKRNAITSGGQTLPEMVVMRDQKRDVVVTMMQRKGMMML